MRKFFVLLLLVWLSISAVWAQDDINGTPAEICEAATPADEPETREYDAPEQVLEAGVDYYAIFCTQAGPIYINLFETLTPVTVNSFVFLAQNGYYNNTTFHRIVNQQDGSPFMAQAGDPTGSGSGGPGYQFQDEPLAFLTFDRLGLLAMANTGQPVTNGSQFFITKSLPDYLNGRHTIFGEVLVGQDVVDALPLRDPATSSEPGPSLDTVVIVTDPASVEVELDEPEAVTVEAVEAAVAEVPELPGVSITEDSGVYTTDEVVVNAPEGLQEDLEDFLTTYNHEFSVTLTHENMTCNLEEAPFQTISYTIHTFETIEDASAALADDFLPRLLAGDNETEVIESELFANPVYTWSQQSCDLDGSSALSYVQNGRLITVSETSYPLEAGIGSSIAVDDWLSQIVRGGVYELVFANVLRLAASGG